MNIPSAKAKTREEYLTHLVVVPNDASVKVVAGKRVMTLSQNDLQHYHGERGRRGNKLPRGLQRVDDVEVVSQTLNTMQSDGSDAASATEAGTLEQSSNDAPESSIDKQAPTDEQPE